MMSSLLSASSMSREIGRVSEVSERLRREIAASIYEHRATGIRLHDDMSGLTSSLPPLTRLPVPFREVVQNALLSVSRLTALTKAKVINWNSSFSDLYPLKCKGGKWSLFHSVFQYLWGITDNDETLQRLLFASLLEKEAEHRQRWAIHYKDGNLLLKELNRTESFKFEWENILKFMEQSRSNNANYRIKSIHIFGLANALCRSIIVYSDKVDKSSLELMGIYLPIMQSPEFCEKTPILLVHKDKKFCALLTDRQKGEEAMIPLVDSAMKLLPVRFLLDEEIASNALISYLNLQEVQQILCATFQPKSLPSELNVTAIHYLNLEQAFCKKHSDKIVSSKCKSEKCTFTGSKELAGMCSICFKQFSKEQALNFSSSICRIKNCTTIKEKDLAFCTLHCQQFLGMPPPIPCITSDCTEMGKLKLQGMCKRCFIVNAVPRKSRHSSSGDELYISDTNTTKLTLGSLELPEDLEDYELITSKTVKKFNSFHSIGSNSSGDGAGSSSSDSIVLLDSQLSENKYMLLCSNQGEAQERLAIQKRSTESEIPMCSVTGCKKMQILNNFGLCLGCSQNNKTLSQMEQSLPAEQIARNNSLNMCLNDDCTNHVENKQKSLCAKCIQDYTILWCRNCVKKGDLDLKGYCRKCNANRAAQAVESQCIKIKPSTEYHNTIKGIENRGKLTQQLCQANGCCNYGNNNKKGFCNRCFALRS